MWLFWLVGLVFLAIGAFLLYRMVVLRQKNRASLGWPKTTGTITESRVESYTSLEKGRRRTRYRARISYTYDVAGKAYTSDQVRFGGFSESNFPGSLQKVVDQYVVGRQGPVSYDPADPATATLQPGASGGITAYGFIGGVFVVISIVMLLIAIGSR